MVPVSEQIRFIGLKRREKERGYSLGSPPTKEYLPAWVLVGRPDQPSQKMFGRQLMRPGLAFHPSAYFEGWEVAQGRYHGRKRMNW